MSHDSIHSYFIVHLFFYIFFCFFLLVSLFSHFVCHAIGATSVVSKFLLLSQTVTFYIIIHFQSLQTLPSPLQWGWEEDDAQILQPTWMTLPEAAEACGELIKCRCTGKCLRCQCNKSGLPCTRLCTCNCETS